MVMLQQCMLQRIEQQVKTVYEALSSPKAFFTSPRMEFDKSYREQVLNVLNQFCDFRVNLSTKMATLAIDWLWHFALFTATADRIW